MAVRSIKHLSAPAKVVIFMSLAFHFETEPVRTFLVSVIKLTYQPPGIDTGTWKL